MTVILLIVSMFLVELGALAIAFLLILVPIIAIAEFIKWLKKHKA